MISFKDFRKLRALGDKRHPMLTNNRAGKIMMYIMGAFWVGYFIFFGTLLGLSLETNNMEGYHLLNSGLIIILALDFCERLPLQKLPSQEIKPFMLLPIKLKRIADYLLLNSALSGFNLFWMFFFVPFAILTLPVYFGISGVICYCIGVWLLILCNNYWYLSCKMLMNRNMLWSLLPFLFYVVIFFVIYSPMMFNLDMPRRNMLFYFFVNLGEGFIMGKIWAFALVLLVLAGTWILARHLLLNDIQEEIYKIDNSKTTTENVSEYHFFERFGELGEFMRLEMKMLLRNKVCKISLFSAIAIVLFFSIVMSSSDVYDGEKMSCFILAYDFCIFGISFLGTIMGYEGNYIDGLMSRKESIYTLLRAKYMFFSLATIIPLLLLIPVMIAGKFAPLTIFAWYFFTIGPIYMTLFQMAVYNRSCISMNKKSTQKNQTGGIQIVINLAVLLLPMYLYIVAQGFLEQNVVDWIWLGAGVLVTITNSLWIKNIYKRLMKRKYINLEGFHNSRSNL